MSVNIKELLLRYQQISIAIRDFSQANPQCNNRKCQMLLKASLKGALNCKKILNQIVVSQKNVNEEEMEDLNESLDVLVVQFRKFGESKFEFQKNLEIERDILVNMDLASIWVRHCGCCRGIGGYDDGRMGAEECCNVMSSQDTRQDTGRFIDIAYAPPPCPDSTTALSHPNWYPPRGHTSYSWLRDGNTTNNINSLKFPPPCRQNSRYGLLLGIVAYIRELECSDCFRKTLINSQVKSDHMIYPLYSLFMEL